MKVFFELYLEVGNNRFVINRDREYPVACAKNSINQPLRLRFGSMDRVNILTYLCERWMTVYIYHNLSWDSNMIRIKLP